MKMLGVQVLSGAQNGIFRTNRHKIIVLQPEGSNVKIVAEVTIENMVLEDFVHQNVPEDFLLKTREKK